MILLFAFSRFKKANINICGPNGKLAPLDPTQPPVGLELCSSAAESQRIKTEGLALNLPKEEQIVMVRKYPCIYCPTKPGTFLARSQHVIEHLKTVHAHEHAHMLICPACGIPVNLSYVQSHSLSQYINNDMTFIIKYSTM